MQALATTKLCYWDTGSPIPIASISLLTPSEYSSHHEGISIFRPISASAGDARQAVMRGLHPLITFSGWFGSFSSAGARPGAHLGLLAADLSVGTAQSSIYCLVPLCMPS